MAKIKKKGTSGTAKNYLTRSQAVRKLQIPLSDFRRLCIFKGIYPREPRSKKRASKSSTPSTTFYYTKDIQFLLHEPLLAKFREQKSVAKKISKALGRNEISDAGRLERNLTPRLRLDHIVKERYPTFVDALRDLDDALSLLCLFATLPSTVDVPAKTIARCQRLTLEFEHYLIRTHALRKSFLSIKGIYYQATIQGQDILWLVPYKFVQRTGGDVDFRIMATFVQFYTALLGFVNFRLYTSIGLVYPPRFDAESEERGAELGAFQLEGKDGEEQARTEGAVDVEVNERAQAEADRLLSLPSADPTEAEDAFAISTGEVEDTEDSVPPPPTITLDQFASIDFNADTLLQPSLTADASVAARLFEPFTFFLSRETPRHPLEFLLKAFGCKRVGWDSSVEGADPGSYCQDEHNDRITHQVVDRPDLPLHNDADMRDDDGDGDDNESGVVVRKANERVPGRTYVQPQWVWDCINEGQLQRPDLYAPGAVLPPHLSPWVKRKEGVYDPTAPLAEMEGEDEEVDEGDDDSEQVEGLEGGVEKVADVVVGEELEDGEEDGEMDVELAASEDDDDHTSTNGKAEDDDDDEWAGISGNEDEDALPDDDARRAQAELEAEALGQPIQDPAPPPSKAKVKQAQRSKQEREKQEDLERRKMMMPRRKRKMFEKMQFSNARRDEEAERLRGKRRRIERGRGRGAQ